MMGRETLYMERGLTYTVRSMNEEATTQEKKTGYERIVVRLSSAVSYIFPLLTTLPNMGYWMGIMVMPFIVYLILMIVSGSTDPLPIPNLNNPTIFVITAGAILTIVFLVWSIVHLHRTKSSGLVTSGPYRFVRHPQYLGFMIITGVMTLQSGWVLQYTNQIGWSNIQLTWLVMLSCYALFAKIEEKHLSTQFPEQLRNYKKEVGCFFPEVKFNSNVVEILSGIIIPFLILQLLLLMMEFTGLVPF